MLGLDNPLHIAFILVLLLLVFGAKRLPEMGKSLGSGLRGFKDSLSGEVAGPELAETHVNATVAETPAPVAPVAPPTVEKVAEPTPMQPAA